MNQGTVHSPLCRAFQCLARWVWTERDRGLVRGLDPTETTFTEIILLELAVRHSRALAVRKFTVPKEARNGADWEWWFADQTHAWGMRVQAKKLQVEMPHFRGDYHGIDASKPRRKSWQINKLLDSALSDGLHPLYCFYNCDRVGLQQQFPAFDSGLLGCTIADGYLVRKKQQDRHWKVSDIAGISLPWHCLVCCPAATSSSGPVVIREWVKTRLCLLDGEARHDVPKVRSLDDAPKYVRELYNEEGTGETILPPIVAGEKTAAGILLIRTDRMFGGGLT